MPTSLLRMRHNSCCGGMRATTRRYRQVAPTGVVGLTKPNRNPLCGYSSVTPKGVPPSLTREGKQRRPSFFYARGFEFFSGYGRKRVALHEPSLVREGGPRQRWMSSHTGAFLLVSPMPHNKRPPEPIGTVFFIRGCFARNTPRHGYPRPSVARRGQ